MVVAIYYKRESNYEVWQECGIKTVNNIGYLRPTEQLLYKEINPELTADWEALANYVNKLGYGFDFYAEWIKEELRNGFSVMCDRTNLIGDYIEIWIANKEVIKNETVR